MLIHAVEIDGVEGRVRIERTDAGALVTCDGAALCEVARHGDEEARSALARKVAGAVCGTGRRGEPLATSSMVHEVLRALETVAGC